MNTRIIPLFLALAVSAPAQDTDPLDRLTEEVAALRAQSARQQAQIEQLLTELVALKEQVETAPGITATAVPPRPLDAPDKPAIVRAPATPDKQLMTSKWETEFYGYVKLDAILVDGEVNNKDIASYAVSDEGSQFNLTAKETRLGLKIGGDVTDEAKVTGRLEVDFYGNTNPSARGSVFARTRLVYADIAFNNGWSVRAGRDWDTYLAIYPKVVNFNALGNQGWPWARRDHVRATYTDGGLLVAASVTSSEGDSMDGSPSFQGKVQYQFDLFDTKKQALIALSGAYDEDAIVGADLDMDLAALSIRLPLTNTWTVEGMLYTGQTLGGPYHAGIAQATYVNGITGLTEALRTTGGILQVHYDPTKQVSINFGYGFDNPEDDADWAARTGNQTAFLNFYYEMFAGVFFASELQYIVTEYTDVLAADANGNITDRRAFEEEALRWQNALIYRF